MFTLHDGLIRVNSHIITFLFQGGNIKVSDDEAAYENTKHNKEVETLRLGSTKSRLFIDCLEEEAEYTCVAETPFRRITTSTKVKLSEYQAISSLSNKHLEKLLPSPRLYMHCNKILAIQQG